MHPFSPPPLWTGRRNPGSQNGNKDYPNDSPSTPSMPTERGKREVYCDKQVGKTVTVLNCVLKGSWVEGRSRSIRKKLKSEYTAYLESKYRRNDGSSI